MYLISFLLSLLSIPGQLITIWTVKSIGPSQALLSSVWLSLCVFIAMAAVLAIAGDVLLTILSLTAQFLITHSFTLCYMITSRAYPTKLSNRAMGLTVVTEEIGAMLSPFIGLDGVGLVDILVFCALTLLGGFSITFIRRRIDVALVEPHDDDDTVTM